MTKSRLLCSAAALLALGVGAAYAQQPPAQPAPAAQQNAPAEKTAPPMNAGQHGPAASPTAKPETTGQAPSNHKTGASENMKTDSPKSGQKSETEMKGTAPQHGAGASPKAETKGSGAADANANGASKTQSTTGQGAAGAHANLTPEQRTKITTVIKQQKVEPVKLNVDVRVGTRIPQTVHYYPLPAEVVTIYPQWRGFDYIVVGETIVVIDPGTREIVAVIDA
jgi:hypothetical protein